MSMILMPSYGLMESSRVGWAIVQFRVAPRPAGPQPRDGLQRARQAGRTHMSSITVLSPLGINRAGLPPLAPRLRSLDRVTLGLLHHHKPNSLALHPRVVEPP